MDLRKLFTRYWALKAVSILLKLSSVVMLLLFCGQLFQLLTLRTNGLNGGLSGGIPGDVFISTNALIDFIIRSVLLIVGAYAAGQLIDLLLSMEQSLRELVLRIRLAASVTRGE